MDMELLVSRVFDQVADRAVDCGVSLFFCFPEIRLIEDVHLRDKVSQDRIGRAGDIDISAMA